MSRKEKKETLLETALASTETAYLVCGTLIRPEKTEQVETTLIAIVFFKSSSLRMKLPEQRRKLQHSSRDTGRKASSVILYTEEMMLKDAHHDVTLVSNSTFKNVIAVGKEPTTMYSVVPLINTGAA